jgi:hypothetical protein
MQQIDFKNLPRHIAKSNASVLSRHWQWMWVLSFLILIALPARAQFGSSLSGTVLDPSGAAIPNATATLTNAATQQKFVSVTNATGAYHFGELGRANTPLPLQPQDSNRAISPMSRLKPNRPAT